MSEDRAQTASDFEEPLARRRLAALSTVAWYGFSGLVVALVGTYIALAILWSANPPAIPVAGTSMRPALAPGDLILVKGADPRQLRKGDVIAFHTPEIARERYGLPGELVHRIVSVTETPQGIRFQTRGDANAGADAFTIRGDDVVGRLAYRVPVLGYPLLFFRSRQGLIFAGAAVAVLLVYVLLGVADHRRDERERRELALLELVEQAAGRSGGAGEPPPGDLQGLAEEVRRSSERSEETALLMRGIVSAVAEYGTHLQSHTAVMQGLAGSAEELHRATAEMRAVLTGAPPNALAPGSTAPETATGEARQTDDGSPGRSHLHLVRPSESPVLEPLATPTPLESIERRQEAFVHDALALVRRSVHCSVLPEGENVVAMNPDELRQMRFDKSLRGYDPAAVELALAGAAETLERTERERDLLHTRLMEIEEEIGHVRELESSLTQTLVSAERTAAELKSQTQRELELMLGEARAQAREIIQEAAAERERLVSEARAEAGRVVERAGAERERLLAEARNVRVLLQTALGTLDERRFGEDIGRSRET